jgi:hypothetical protein
MEERFKRRSWPAVAVAVLASLTLGACDPGANQRSHDRRMEAEAYARAAEARADEAQAQRVEAEAKLETARENASTARAWRAVSQTFGLTAVFIASLALLGWALTLLADALRHRRAQTHALATEIVRALASGQSPDIEPTASKAIGAALAHSRHARTLATRQITASSNMDA